MSELLKEYGAVRENGVGFFEKKIGFIEVSGTEAVQFLNGLITNDVKGLADKTWMLAAFPNAQGRLLALVRVLRCNDKFYFEIDKTNYESILQNLTRFTFAGDFKVRDFTETHTRFSLRFPTELPAGEDFPSGNDLILIPNEEDSDENCFIIRAFRGEGLDFIFPKNGGEKVFKHTAGLNAVLLSDETLEVLRIENGEPKFGVDMDESTVVLETGINDAVSFTKGCYIGQEIIARIHFRGHVAKQLTGLVLANNVELKKDDELISVEGKPAGKITSNVFSPKLNRRIALAYVRYDFLAEETELFVNGISARVTKLPFIENKK